MKNTKEQLIRKKEILKVQKMRKRIKLREKGITLIALVVTIIVLLILTGVTLNMALSDNGLFKKAREAVEKYEKAQEDEEEAIRQISTQMYSEYVGAKVTGYEPIAKTAEEPCTITVAQSGHTEDQTFTTDVAETEETSETGMQWRVWDFDGNILRIIGDPTKETLTLSGAAGYNNGVWAIEKICNDCYSNERKGVTVTSLKRTDIQKVSSYDYTQYKHEKGGWIEVTDNSVKDEDLIYFGESKSDYPNENKKYPEMWGKNDKDWEYGYDSKTKAKTGNDAECKIWESKGEYEGKLGSTMTQGSEETTFKQSYYNHEYSENEFQNKKYYDLIFGEATRNSVERYWLAGRSICLYKELCSFGLSCVARQGDESKMSGLTLCISKDGEEYDFALAIRPMVSINLKSSNCVLEVVKGEDGDVTECKLSWNEE